MGGCIGKTGFWPDRHMGGGIPMGKGSAGNKFGRKDRVREEGLVDLL